MPNRKLPVIIALLGALLVVGVWYATRSSSQGSPGQGETQANAPAKAADISTGKPAPDFSLPSLTGERVSLSDFRGQVVILNFWATWCPPCKEEMPDLNRFYLEEKDKGVMLLAVNIMQRDTPEGIRSFMKDNGYDMPVLLDESQKVGATYRVAYIPTTYFIDREGIIRYSKTGALNSTEIAYWVEKLRK
ncbi:hypothetical protein SY88_19775 [Clostridiales bacterium PH28_bin88]|nr:hypothetical protein SY88_19775 [Clostridiales bacterium PH28_bin88]